MYRTIRAETSAYSLQRTFMKHLIGIVALIMALQVHAQNDSSGIYLSGNDFNQSKLYLAIDCKTEAHKIKLNDFFGKNYITVIHKDSAYKLYKSNIFGYRTCDGQIVRFLKKRELVLLNPTESILIYRNEVTKPPKGRTNVTNFYFSKDASSPVLMLTMSNVKKAYPENHVFHEKLDALFKYNTELAFYDEFHKMYRLNWVFQMSK